MTNGIHSHCKRLAFIGGDIYIECSTAAYKMGNHLQGKGSIATIGVIDPTNTEAEIKNRIFCTQLANHYPDINIVENAGGGKYEIKNIAYNITQGVLQRNPDLSGIYSNADETMRGIVQAVQEAGRDICIIGYGNEPHIMEYMEAGQVTYSMLHNRFSYGFNAMVLLYNKIVAGLVPTQSRILINPQVVDKRNLEDYWSPSKGYLISEETKRSLLQPVSTKPKQPVHLELHLEGQGVWFDEIINGAKEAEKILPDTSVHIENWRISDLTNSEIHDLRVKKLNEAQRRGARGVDCWLLNESFIPHINNAVEYGMEVVIFHTEPVNYDMITPEIDDVFASLFQQMILKDEAERRLKELSYTDELTGMYNRRRLTTLLQQELSGISRTGKKIAVLMIDIDHFKQINDKYGHLIGDICLKHTADTLQSSLRRARDFCGRYGGEEFVAVLPATDLQGAQQIAEQIRTNVENLHDPDFPAIDKMRISIGIAAGNANDTWQQVLDKADGALYRSKDEGRNRVTVHNEPDTPALSKS